MSQAFGHEGWVGVGKESVYGTPVAPTRFVEITSEGIKGEHSFLSLPALRSPSQKNRVKSKKSVAGAAIMQLPFEGAEILLEAALGSVNTSGTGPYNHAFSLASSLPTGLTVVVNRDADALGGSSAFQYSGCQVQKLTLRQEVENFLEAEFEFIGQDWSNIAKPAPTFPTFQGIDWEMLTAQLDPLGTPVTLNLRRLEIGIENALADDRYVLGSRLRRGLGRSAARIVNGSFDIEFEDLTLYAYFRDLVADGTNQLTFEWDAPSGNDNLLISIPNVAFDGEDPSISDAGPIIMTMNFTAYADSADNDELSLLLVNDVAAPIP